MIIEIILICFSFSPATVSRWQLQPSGHSLLKMILGRDLSKVSGAIWAGVAKVRLRMLIPETYVVENEAYTRSTPILHASLPRFEVP